jgi:ribosomal protein S18 acetylase RimI-like enzyme
MNYEIVPLPKETWKGTVVPIRYTTDTYYDLELTESENAFTARLVKKQFDTPVTHTPEEYDFPDRLYQDFWEKAEAYGAVGEAGELLACIELCPEEWSNRLLVTELWVSDGLQGQGLGKRLMDKAKEIAVLQKRRAIILETQSCNTKAIGFYLHQGFVLIGFDSCCYTNDDIARREVRVNLGYFFHRNGRRS